MDYRNDIPLPKLWPQLISCHIGAIGAGATNCVAVVKQTTETHGIEEMRKEYSVNRP
jgi:hypothetical protein